MPRTRPSVLIDDGVLQLLDRAGLCLHPVVIEAMRLIAWGRRGRCRSDECINLTTKLEWLCEVGHAWHAQPASILTGT
ncbi:hypothetical protein BURKHO8Y_30233 [Burkholderia sp. 8Y]|nr:hypothetical protein BURKHO8Y_30233 [Burkholderia sp. 8Y]